VKQDQPAIAIIEGHGEYMEDFFIILFSVNKRFEISDLELIRDMADIVKLEKVFTDFSSPYAFYFCI
jgi:hypothetical protein